MFNLTIKYTKQSTVLQKTTLEYSAYTTFLIKGLLIYDFDGHNDFRIVFGTNNDFIKTINIENLTCYYGLVGNVISEHSIAIVKCKTCPARAHQIDSKTEFYNIDIPISDTLAPFVAEIKEVNELRIEITLEVNNCFGIVTMYSGEAIFEKHPQEPRTYKCRRSFVNIQSIKQRD